MGRQFCTSMPPVNGGQSASGCFDSSVTTAEAMCQNMFQWKTTPSGAVNNQDPFHYWLVSQVEQTANEHDCKDIAANVGPQSYGLDTGPVASLTMQGTTTSLRAKGGFAKVGVVCDSESESCSTILTSMKIQFQDVTISGLTLHNPEAALVAPATTDFYTGKLPAGSVKIDIEGDVTAIRTCQDGVLQRPAPDHLYVRDDRFAERGVLGYGRHFGGGDSRPSRGPSRSLRRRPRRTPRAPTRPRCSSCSGSRRRPTGALRRSRSR